MIASSPVYLGICIQLIKLTGFAAEFKTTQILLFLESSRPEARTSSYSPCLCQYSQAQHLFYRIYAFLTIQDKNAFSKAISVSDTAFPPCPQHMASILVNNCSDPALTGEPCTSSGTFNRVLHCVSSMWVHQVRQATFYQYLLVALES